MRRIFNPGNLLIKNCKIFGKPGYKASDILIENNIIKKILPSGKIGKLPALKSINLKGNMIYPGFNDAHTHFMWLGLKMLRINLDASESVDDLYNIVSEAVKKYENGKPLIGEGYDESKWTNKTPISKKKLDELAPNNPLVLRRVCGHRGYANTNALKKIPADCMIVKRDTGELFEDVVLYIHRIFPPSEDELMLGLSKAIKLAEKEGVTSITDVVNKGYFNIYQKYFQKYKPKLRVSLYFVAALMDEIIGTGMLTGFGNEYLKIRGIKVFTDGSIGAYTAAIYKNYIGKKTKGILIYNSKKLESLIEKVNNNNLQLMIHAIGDRAIQQVLDTFNKVGYSRKLRHRLEHIELVSDKQLKKIKEMGLIASMQPNFVGEWSGPGEMYDQRLPEYYYRQNNPIKKISKLKIPMAFGSDCMPFGPKYGIESAVKHPIPGSEINLNRAIEAYTTGSAFAEHEEKIKGKIKVGYLADLVYNIKFNI
ncbi:amidohydrolase family protein [Candidatus Dependentiae bacterium]|nr:amidohydrolase family protein [Candidatus Dependentiae bacterium]